MCRRWLVKGAPNRIARRKKSGAERKKVRVRERKAGCVGSRF